MKKNPLEKWEEAEKRLTHFKIWNTIWECEWGKDPIPTKLHKPSTEKEIETATMKMKVLGL